METATHELRFPEPRNLAVSSESQRISCPQCRASLKVVVATPGEPQICPKCGAKFLPPAREPVAGSSVDPNAEWDDLFGPTPAAKLATAPAPPAAPRPASAPAPAPAPAPASAQRPSEPPALAPARPASPETDGPLPFDDTDDEPPSASHTPSPRETPQSVGGEDSSDDGDEFRLSAPVDKPSLQVAELADRYTFSVGCRVCGTLIDCLSTEIGRTVQCPDCHSKLVVPSPRDTQSRTPVQQHPLATGTVQELAPAPLPTGEAQRGAGEAFRANADKLLAQAKAEQDEIDQREGEGFDNSKAADIFRFLIDPQSIARLAGLAVAGMMALTLIRWSRPLFASEGGGGIGDLVLLATVMIAVPVTACWLIAAAAHAMALFRDTAAGQGKIGWPDVNFFDWLGQGLYVLLSAVYSGLPGAVLAAMMSSAGVSWIYSLFVVMLSWIALFPPTFVSMSHEASLAGLVSLPVYRSMRELRGPWILFYQASLLLGLVTWGLLVMAMADSVLVVPVAVCGTMLTGSLYFRILGWVGGQLGPVLAPDDEDAADETADSER